jgi:glycosyltransferase involved in cell wall biosynthesis
MSTAQPLFTVATITYNSGKWVQQAIESVLASSFTDFELLVSDDCSTDDTWDIIQQYSDPRIKAWRNEKNIGEYSNRNKVLKHAKGKYFLFVDGDDILYKTTLRNLSEYVQEFPDAASVWGVPSARFWFAFLPYQFEPEITTRLIYETTIPLAEIGFAETLFKTEILRAIGGFSTKYRIGDTLMKKKIGTCYPVLFVPMGFMLWRFSEGQASQKVNQIKGAGFENILIDKEIFSSVINRLDPEKKEALWLDIQSSFIKNLLINTLRKCKFRMFFLLMREAGLSFWTLKLIFRKRTLNYLPVKEISAPLVFPPVKLVKYNE